MDKKIMGSFFDMLGMYHGVPVPSNFKVQNILPQIPSRMGSLGAKSKP